MEKMDHAQHHERSQARPARRRRPVAIAVRVVAIVVVVVLIVGLAHVLRNPAGFGDEDVEVSGVPVPSGEWPPEVDVSGVPPQTGGEKTTRREADDDLRQIMAGIMMAALDDGAGNGEGDRPPSEQQRRIADWFGLPYDYPASQAPADLMPDSAEVLMVFDNPRRRGCRMVLVRMREGVGEALEAFYRHYGGMGWEGEDLTRERPRQYAEAQPDAGWLVHFRKGRRERIVYARPRSSGQETLLAIYEPGYDADSKTD